MPGKPAKSNTHTSAREAAYLALLAVRREEGFISDALDSWIRTDRPSPRDAALAREIAYGACRMALALDHAAAQCAATGKLSLKTKEKLLLHTALYQRLYLERIPLYAIADETISIARRHCHATFVKFLNATLRKLEDFTPTLPEGNAPEALSVSYSYPRPFIDMLMKDYGPEETLAILAAGNAAAPTMVRLRHPDALTDWKEDEYTFLPGTNHRMAVLNKAESIARAAASPRLYIQNATPAELMQFLAHGSRLPNQVLDMCASPGGKLLLAHDLFPAAKLHANDLTEAKLARLQENIDKYSLCTTLTCCPGEQLQPPPRYDLIILDAPCSNAGVLNKRPEARWRLTPAHIRDAAALQRKLLENAAGLLAPGGEIWYMTCSILPEENERLVHEMCPHLHLRVRTMKTILPNAKGWDGGFGCALETIGGIHVTG